MQSLKKCCAHSPRQRPSISIVCRAIQSRKLSQQAAGSCQQHSRAHLSSQHFTSLRARMSTSSPAQAKPKFSAGSDEPKLAQQLRKLLASTDGTSVGRWTLISSGEGLERSFKFKTFAKTWDFMTAVALQCKLKNHHPEWSNVYNTVFIRWTTHNPQGLSAQDIEFASICDSIAKDFGDIVEDSSGATSCSMGQQLADIVASTAGDCCTPKPKSNA